MNFWHLKAGPCMMEKRQCMILEQLTWHFILCIQIGSELYSAYLCVPLLISWILHIFLLTKHSCQSIFDLPLEKYRQVAWERYPSICLAWLACSHRKPWDQSCLLLRPYVLLWLQKSKDLCCNLPCKELSVSQSYGHQRIHYRCGQGTK